MAKQVGDIIIVGTIDDITFYKMEGKGYARLKTSLTGKRVQRDPKFKRTMESARRLARGSRLASKVYRSLPRVKQVYALFKELKSIAISAFKEGASEAEVMLLLERKMKPVKSANNGAVVKKIKLTAAIHSPLFTKWLFKVKGQRKGKMLKWARCSREVFRNRDWDAQLETPDRSRSPGLG